MNKILITILFSITAIAAQAQVVEVDKFKNMKAKNLLKFSGGISANSIFYAGNGDVSRAPFTYFLNGTLNARIADLIDAPISFNISNAGRNFDLPTAPTRIGIHPKYKFITGHLGDVSMVFSPYSLNGFLFRGAGFDVEPEGRWHVSAMAGRLQKAVEYDTANQIVPAAYQRFGYGTKLTYRRNLYRVGFSLFAAKDKINSLQFKPDSLDIYPKQNVVLTWFGTFTPIDDVEITAEYASSALTQNLRDTFAVVTPDRKLIGAAVNRNNTTSFYRAIKANVNYKYNNSVLGIGFERIDPGYETLGAYYFNNDLQNITVNVAQPFQKNKGQINANIGLQKDNLDNQKIGTSKRTVYSINANYMPVKKLMSTISYSNFTTFQRIQPIFQNLNQTVTPYANLDTLNYSQVSRNANANINYSLVQKENQLQSINTNLSYMNVSDRQGGVKQFGANTQLMSLAASYTIVFIPKDLSIVTAFNTTTSKVANSSYTLLGPTVSVSKRFFKKLTTTFVSAYNSTQGNGPISGSVLINRANLAYTLKKKQNFNLSVINQNRSIKTTGVSTNDILITTGYNYFF